MPYVPLPTFLFRAPLLPLASLSTVGQRLVDHPMGPTAIGLASPDLAAALARGSAGQARAIDRYERRAAFRPTPHGLFAGVGVGTLALRSRVRTGTPAAVPRITWSRLASLGRALLNIASIRAEARLRRAPSVIVGAHIVVWLGPGEEGGFVEERRAHRDELIDCVLEQTETWTPWTVVRAAVAVAGGQDNDEGEGEGGLDELLATMIDDGLLHVDLVPPLVGRDPLTSLCDRLTNVEAPEREALLDMLAIARAAVSRGDTAGLSAVTAKLPGGESGDPGVDATLVFSPSSAPTLSQEAAARAAALVPLLYRLQETLSPPVAERTPAEAMADALIATNEIFGAGALQLDALVVGDYGVDVRDDDQDGDDQREGGDFAAGGGGIGAGEAAYPSRVAAGPRINAPLLTLLIDRFTAAARQGDEEVALGSDELAALLPPATLPPTCELFVTPCRARARKPPGFGWLLGLHGPAGATWGRFAHALGGAAADSLLRPLLDGEQTARPGEHALDVVFAPAEALADVCAHPALRPAALALTGWPAEGVAAITVADLELCADAAALEPLALRTRDGRAVSPSPLHRARSTTAPPGAWRLLAGWTLQRQHAPWVMTLGPLQDLEWTPRISIDGFVVAPAGWRIPAWLSAGGATAKAVRRWRRDAGVPRFVQVGAEDELLPVDLTRPSAAGDLVGHARAFEIWPALGDTPDESGRRFEAVIGLYDRPTADERARVDAVVRATVHAGAVPPPRRSLRAAPSERRWTTFKLFAAADSHDALLVDFIHPCIRAARAAGECSAWFFLRYIDGPGKRPHLRVRVEAAGGAAAFTERLNGHLEPAFEDGDVVAIETASYFPEAARFGGAQVVPAVHALFEADSDRACALLSAEAARDDEGDWPDVPDSRMPLLVATFDATARALGLDGPARRQLARRRRAVHAGDVGPAMAEATARAFRTLKAPLRAALGGDSPPSVTTALDAYESHARRAVEGLDVTARGRLLPPLLHLSAVRLMGLDWAAEVAAYTFWERTLESLERHRPS